MKQSMSFRRKLILLSFGFLAVIFVSEGGLRFRESLYALKQQRRFHEEHNQKDGFVILCLGESTTALGEDTAYPAQVEKILNQRMPERHFTVINRGIPGIDTASIVKDLNYNLSKHKPDMVTVMMGINDELGNIPEQPHFIEQVKGWIKSLRLYRLAKLYARKGLNIDVVRSLYFERGKEYSQQRRYSRAEDVFKAMVILSPLDAEAYFELGLCYQAQGALHKAQESLHKAISLNGKDYSMYLELARSYREQEDYSNAEDAFRKAFQINPYDKATYIELAGCLLERKEFSKAEEVFKKAIENEPGSEDGYFELAGFYKELKRYKDAELMFRKAIAIRPENEMSYIGLGLCYKEEGKQGLSEEMFKKAIEIKPRVGEAYLEAGEYYKEKNDYFHAEEILKKAIEAFPKEELAYELLAECYIAEKKNGAAKAILNKLIVLNRNNEWAFRCLGSLEYENGKYKEAEVYFQKARQVTGWYQIGIRSNYNKLKKEILTKKIPLVCVQYPVRRLEGLKNLFNSTEGIIFVDNEKIFKELLKKGSYDDYFVDRFAGNFGHFNPVTNRIVARNIAETIIKEYFRK